jgi:hypothetical protein
MAEKDLGPLKDRLKGYCEHVPPSVNAGSYNLSVEFKQTVAKQRKLLTKRGVTEAELVAGINSLHRYWI